MNGNTKKQIAIWGTLVTIAGGLLTIVTLWTKGVEAITPAVAAAVEDKISDRLQHQDKDIERNEDAMIALARKHDQDMVRMMEKFDTGMREIRTSLATMDGEQQKLLLEVLRRMGGN